MKELRNSWWFTAVRSGGITFSLIFSDQRLHCAVKTSSNDQNKERRVDLWHHMTSFAYQHHMTCTVRSWGGSGIDTIIPEVLKRRLFDESVMMTRLLLKEDWSRQKTLLLIPHVKRRLHQRLEAKNTCQAKNSRLIMRGRDIKQPCISIKDSDNLQRNPNLMMLSSKISMTSFHYVPKIRLKNQMSKVSALMTEYSNMTFNLKFAKEWENMFRY